MLQCQSLTTKQASKQIAMTETSVKAESDDSDASVKKEVASKKSKKPSEKAAETKKSLLNILMNRIDCNFNK